MKTVILRDETYAQILAIKSKLEQRHNKCFSMGSVVEELLKEQEKEDDVM